MSGKEYIKSAVKNIERLFDDDDNEMKLNSKIILPMDPSYRPGIDITPTLDREMISRYKQLIGILRWASEIGCINILHDVSKLSLYNSQPRE